MQAVRIHEHGGPEALRVEDIPEPELGAGQVLVRVLGVSVNHLDLFVRTGLPGLKLPIIPGCDGTGEIVAIGPGVTGLATGDRVVIEPGLSSGKSRHDLEGNDHLSDDYGIRGEHVDGLDCELIAIEARFVFPLPGGLDPVQAAAVPLVFLTAWGMLVTRAKVRSGESVLILGGASGVGSAAIQVAKDLGARVLATAGSESKRTLALELGADEVIDHTQEDWGREVTRLTDGRGVDVAVEHVGAATWTHSLRSLARNGRLVTCGATTGPTVKIQLQHLFMKNLSIFGSTMGPRGALPADHGTHSERSVPTGRRSRDAPLRSGPRPRADRGARGRREDRADTRKLGASMQAETIGVGAVIGAGTMGHGIAQVLAMCGIEARLFDIDEARVQAGMAKVRSNLDKGVEKGKVDAALRDSACARLSGTTDMDAAIEGTGVVVEAVPEKIELKRGIFAELGSKLGAEVLLATNTSSLPITEIAAAAALPERVVGMHFFNPVHIMKLVEVVRAEQSSPEAVQCALDLARRMKKEPIDVKDSPGFASSRLGLVIGLEAMRMVEAEVASAEDIDKAMVLGYGFPMGPLKLTDLVGLDVRLSIAEHLAREISDRFQPPQILRDKVARGELGKKAGVGFYDWKE